jgi:hypothetical protein
MLRLTLFATLLAAILLAQGGARAADLTVKQVSEDLFRARSHQPPDFSRKARLGATPREGDRLARTVDVSLVRRPAWRCAASRRDSDVEI